MPVRSLKDATVTISDDGGSGGGDSVTVDVEVGDFSFTQRQPVNIISDRGILDHARKANEEPIEFSLSMQFQSFSTHESPSPYDAVTKTGGASSWTSDEPNSDAYAVILEVTITDPAGGSAEVITIVRAFVEGISFTEGDPSDTLSFSGRALDVQIALS